MCAMKRSYSMLSFPDCESEPCITCVKLKAIWDDMGAQGVPRAWRRLLLDEAITKHVTGQQQGLMQ
jgi:hypothetical protein